MRAFEKISFNQFKKDVADDKELYDSIELPKRSTKLSAGYDLKANESGIIKPKTSVRIRTGLKVRMQDNETLLLVPRSSLGAKYNVRLANGVGVIDADYYNNSETEGHFSVVLFNDSEKDFEYNIGDRIAQGIFINYLTVSNEEEIENVREGGFGSTNKE